MTMDCNIDTSAIQKAAARTGQLIGELYAGGGDLRVVYESYESIGNEVAQAGYDLTEFLPDVDKSDLNFSLPDFGRRFFAEYAKVVKARLCASGSELRSSIDKALSSGVGALIAVLAAALAVPTAVVILLAPIAAVLVGLGIEAFCEMSVDESASH